jgi:hypothetical protein
MRQRHANNSTLNFKGKVPLLLLLLLVMMMMMMTLLNPKSIFDIICWMPHPKSDDV